MKKLKFLLIMLVISQSIQAQRYMTQNGVISFFSSTPVEDIEAVNNQVSAVLNAENGEIASVLLLKAFNFEKALMQEHFNEKYVESEKYPKSTFKGKIENFSDLKLAKGSAEDVIIKGELSIHGVTNKIEVIGKLLNDNGVMDLKFAFQVQVADYNIEIPGPVKEKIAKTIDIDAHFKMNKM
jgi:hypothetical protein